MYLKLITELLIQTLKTKEIIYNQAIDTLSGNSYKSFLRKPVLHLILYKVHNSNKPPIINTIVWKSHSFLSNPSIFIFLQFLCSCTLLTKTNIVMTKTQISRMSKEQYYVKKSSKNQWCSNSITMNGNNCIALATKWWYYKEEKI